MNDITKEIFKQILTLLRLSAFIPLGGIIGLLTNIAGLGSRRDYFWKDQFGKLLDRMCNLRANIWLVCCLLFSLCNLAKIYPSKSIHFWLLYVIGVIIFSAINMINNPISEIVGFPWSIETATEIFFVIAIPIGVLVWFVKDEKNGLFALKKNLEKARNI